MVIKYVFYFLKIHFRRSNRNCLFLVSIVMEVLTTLVIVKDYAVEAFDQISFSIVKLSLGLLIEPRFAICHCSVASNWLKQRVTRRAPTFGFFYSCCLSYVKL